MKAFLIFVLLAAGPALAQQKPIDIDPNTKTEGGADVRESGARAGARIEDKMERDNRRIDADSAEKDKPVTARKPREEERPSEEAAKGSTAKPQ